MFKKWAGLTLSACGTPFFVIPIGSVLKPDLFAVFVIGFGLVLLGVFVSISQLIRDER